MNVKSVQITIPAVIAHNNDKIQAFEAGWRHRQGMENPLFDEVVAKLNLPQGEGLKVYQDTVRPCSELENVLWWGYFASCQEKRAKVKKSRSITPECNVGEQRQILLTELHDRMAHNPSFIPKWA